MISEAEFSRAKVNSLYPNSTKAPGNSVWHADFGIFSKNSEDSNPSPMPLKRSLCSLRLHGAPFKHSGNQAIELGGFSKGSSIM